MYDLTIKYKNTTECYFDIPFDRVVKIIISNSKDKGFDVHTKKFSITQFKNIIDRGYKRTFTTVDNSEITIKPKVKI